MDLKNNNLFIRTDANSEIGLGHLMRCIALAQCWEKIGGRVTFIARFDSDVLCDRLISEGFDFIPIERSFPDPLDWEITEQVLRKSTGAWVICDGYHFDSQYHRNVKNSGYSLCVTDDTAHLRHYYADILLNQNGHANGLFYSCEKNTSLLLGSKYVLLRREILDKKDFLNSTNQKVRKILITMGGSDPGNQTQKLINLVKDIKPKDIEVCIVAGVSNPNVNNLKETVYETGASFQLIHNPDNMADIIAGADIAISAGGSTCWESAFMGIPLLVVITADNQEGIATFLEKKGVAINLGWSDSLSPKNFTNAFEKLVFDYKVRKEMSACGQQLIDGFGADRIVRAMMEKGNEKN
jgi:UDP-2,4-diacetamido-2,4,6-trideoxy-beta-L-altropyranose hydrolase